MRRRKRLVMSPSEAVYFISFTDRNTGEQLTFDYDSVVARIDDLERIWREFSPINIRRGVRPKQN